MELLNSLSLCIFCEPRLTIVQENKSMRNIKQQHSIFDKNKRKAVNRLLLLYSWKLFIKIFIKVVAVRHSKWKVFLKQTFHLTSTIYLLLRCLTEKQIQLYKYINIKKTRHISFICFFKFCRFSCFHLFCVLYFVW